MNIMVTGGAGFIGSNFIRYVLYNYCDYSIINVDSLTYAGNLNNLSDLENDKRYTFIKADIVNKAELEDIFNRFDINIVVNFAAETHVDRSINNPDVFVMTNIIGTFNLLELCKKHWIINNPDKYTFEYKPNVKYVQISTDEVYGSLGETGKFTELSPLTPNSPYSSSKASADMIVKSYFSTYKLPINITRCSNNYGPYQFPEKLIPLVINNCLNNKKIPVYGNGLQIRDWLYVEDHCFAIDMVMRKGKSGEVYNVGGSNEKTNIDLITKILEYIGKSKDLIEYVTDRPGHDIRYAIDSSKLQKDLGWRPKYNFDNAIIKTVDWYIENKQWLNNVLNKDYMNYYNQMYNR